jgi:hypothetical protein
MRAQVHESLRYAVLIRDDFKCQLCGKRGKLWLKDYLGVGLWCDLLVHHIYSNRTNDPANLVTVCDKCHLELHGGAFKKGVIPQLIDVAPCTPAMIAFGKELSYWLNDWGFIKKIRFG